MKKQYPIIETDYDKNAIIDPKIMFRHDDRIPEYCVMCFFDEVIKKLLQSGEITILRYLESTMGPQPVYIMKTGRKDIALVHPGIGAPMAAITMEKLIAVGNRKFIAAGGAGVLNHKMVLGHIIIPDSAVRDEGTSYHYLPASRESYPTENAFGAILKTLELKCIRYTVGKTWTSDAFFRETPAKVKLRRGEGCISVEMEAAALFAVAKFREVELAQILYSADVVCTENGWDHRNWQKAICREDILRLAAEACAAV